MKKAVLLTITAISILIGLLAGRQLNISSLPDVVDMRMTSDGRIYILQYTLQDGYHLQQYSPGGRLERDCVLPGQEGSQTVRYTGLEMDEKNYIYLTGQTRRNQVTDDEGTENSVVTQETVDLYDDSLHLVRRAATLKNENLHTQAGIRSVQAIDQQLYIVYGYDAAYEVIRVDALQNGSPVSHFSFLTHAPDDFSMGQRWLTAAAVAWDGMSVYYATADGGLYRTDGKHTADLTAKMDGRGLPADMFTSPQGQICFTEQLSQTLYEIDPESETAKKPYTRNSLVDGKDQVAFDEVSLVQMDAAGRLYGLILDQEHARVLLFGSQPTRRLHATTAAYAGKSAAVALAVWTALMLVLVLIRLKRVKMQLAVRIWLMVFPLYAVGAGIAVPIAARMSVRPLVRQNEQVLAAQAGWLAQQISHAGLGQSEDFLAGVGSSAYRTASDQFRQTVWEQNERLGRCDEGVFYGLARGRYCSIILSEPAEIPRILEGDAAVLQQKFLQDEGGAAELKLDRRAGTMTALAPVADADRISGVVSVTAPITPIVQTYRKNLHILITVAIFATALLFLWLIFVLRRCLRPLRAFRQCVDHVIDGQWSEKVDVTSNDELSEIAVAFNIMMDKMQQYIANLTDLNHAYLKFVPRELFQLMGKKYVTEVRLHDAITQQLNLLYLRFTMGKCGEQEQFEIMNNCFDRLFAIVQKNGGVVQHYDGLGMLVLFTEKADAAAAAGVQCVESFAGSVPDGRVLAVVSAGKSLVGVAGSAGRNEVVAVSEEIARIHHIAALMDCAGLSHVVTQAARTRLECAGAFCLRLVGQTSSDGERLLYQSLDGIPFYEKKLYLATRDVFEQGVRAFMARDLATARKCFSEAVTVNASDQAAIYYLKRCEELAQLPQGKWNGLLF